MPRNNFIFTRRRNKRHLHAFSAAERPVCVPYKRKEKAQYLTS